MITLTDIDDSGESFILWIEGISSIPKERAACNGINPEADSNCWVSVELHEQRLNEWHSRQDEPLTQNRISELEASNIKRRNKHALPQRT